ncbi:auxin efflux carrier family protein, partial [Phenoliferia sp. Uapishka_3]
MSDSAPLNILATVVLALKASSLAVLQVALVVISGYALAYWGMLDKDLQKKLNILNANLFTPALILSKIAPTLSLHKLVQLVMIPLAFVVFTGVSTGVGFATNIAFRVPRGNRRIVTACSMAVNSNSLPIALVASLSSNVEALKMSPTDDPDAMLARGISYLILYSTLGLIWRWSFMVSFLAKANAGVSHGEELGISIEDSSKDSSKPIVPLWRRILRAFLSAMTPPLWAAVLAVVIAIIPPVQKAYKGAAPLTGAINSVAGISIPITLIVLGGYFVVPKKGPEDDSSPIPGMARTVWASVLSRMVISPLPLYGLICALALGTYGSLVEILDDPVFLLVMFLLAGGPTALTIAQVS